MDEKLRSLEASTDKRFVSVRRALNQSRTFGNLRGGDLNCRSCPPNVAPCNANGDLCDRKLSIVIADLSEAEPRVIWPDQRLKMRFHLLEGEQTVVLHTNESDKDAKDELTRLLLQYRDTRDRLFRMSTPAELVPLVFINGVCRVNDYARGLQEHQLCAMYRFCAPLQAGKRCGLLFAHFMGTGKTLMSIACVALLCAHYIRLRRSDPERPGPPRIVVIAPDAIRGTYIGEWEAWTNCETVKSCGPEHVLTERENVLGYKQLERVFRGGSEQEKDRVRGLIRGSVLVMDETHNLVRLRNEAVANDWVPAWNAIFQTCASSEHIICLTGTPIELNLFDIVPIVNLVSMVREGTPVLPTSVARFRQRYMDVNRTAKTYTRRVVAPALNTIPMGAAKDLVVDNAVAAALSWWPKLAQAGFSASPLAIFAVAMGSGDGDVGMSEQGAALLGTAAVMAFRGLYMHFYMKNYNEPLETLRLYAPRTERLQRVLGDYVDYANFSDDSSIASRGCTRGDDGQTPYQGSTPEFPTVHTVDPDTLVTNYTLSQMMLLYKNSFQKSELAADLLQEGRVVRAFDKPPFKVLVAVEMAEGRLNFLEGNDDMRERLSYYLDGLCSMDSLLQDSVSEQVTDATFLVCCSAVQAAHALEHVVFSNEAREVGFVRWHGSARNTRKLLETELLKNNQQHRTLCSIIGPPLPREHWVARFADAHVNHALTERLLDDEEMLTQVGDINFLRMGMRAQWSERYAIHIDDEPGDWRDAEQVLTQTEGYPISHWKSWEEVCAVAERYRSGSNVLTRAFTRIAGEYKGEAQVLVMRRDRSEIQWLRHDGAWKTGDKMARVSLHHLKGPRPDHAWAQTTDDSARCVRLPAAPHNVVWSNKYERLWEEVQGCPRAAVYTSFESFRNIFQETEGFPNTGFFVNWESSTHNYRRALYDHPLMHFLLMCHGAAQLVDLHHYGRNRPDLDEGYPEYTGGSRRLVWRLYKDGRICWCHPTKGCTANPADAAFDSSLLRIDAGDVVRDVAAGEEHPLHADLRGRFRVACAVDTTSSDPITQRKREPVLFDARRENAAVQLLLIHPTITEGMSLFAVKQMHILEPIKSGARYQQVVARAVRNGSHKEVEDKRIDLFRWKCRFVKNLGGSIDAQYEDLAQVPTTAAYETLEYVLPRGVLDFMRTTTLRYMSRVPLLGSWLRKNIQSPCDVEAMSMGILFERVRRQANAAAVGALDSQTRGMSPDERIEKLCDKGNDAIASLNRIMSGMRPRASSDLRLGCSDARQARTDKAAREIKRKKAAIAKAQRKAKRAAKQRKKRRRRRGI